MTDYATVAQVKSFTRIDFNDFRGLSTSDFDTLVGVLITTASANMDEYTTRDFANHTGDVQTYSVGDFHTRYIRVKGPINTLTKVEFRSGPGDGWGTVESDTYAFENFDIFADVPTSDISNLYKVSFGQNEINRLTVWNARSIGSTRWKREKVRWWRGYDNIRVTCDYGYATVPRSVQDTCVFLVDYWLQLLLKEVVAKKGAITDPEGIGSKIPYDLPDFIKEKLEPWKSHVGQGVV